MAAGRAAPDATGLRPDGGSLYARGAVPVNLAGQAVVLRSFHSTSLAGPMQSPVQTRATGQGPIVSAILQCVIFADGQFAGVDEQWVFEAFGRMIKAIVEVGLLAKTGAWDQLEALALSRRLEPFPSGKTQQPTLNGEQPHCSRAEI